MGKLEITQKGNRLKPSFVPGEILIDYTTNNYVIVSSSGSEKTFSGLLISNTEVHHKHDWVKSYGWQLYTGELTLKYTP